MKEDHKKQHTITFNSEEEILLKKYLEEYNDTYPKILLLNPFEFFQNIIKGLELSLKEELNGFSKKVKSKIEDYLIEKVYPSDYKFALFIKKNIKNRTQEEILSHYFKGEILSHCDDDKCGDYYIHTCGEKFQFFKYKISSTNTNTIINLNKKYLSDFDNNSYNNSTQPQYDICLFCEKCEMIYRSNFIRFKCSLTGEEFYSKTISNNDNNNDNNYYQLATWKHYHCNAVINDKMKCQSCHNELYFISPTKVLCKSCRKELNPLDIKYKCIVCKEDFSSEAKNFNPLEYKALKICIKEAIISKIKARPNKIRCGCDSNININKTKFIHRKQCKGELFLGELNNKKVVICNKCDSLGLYDNYIWTCPLCFKKFRDEDKDKDKETDEDKSKNKIKDIKPKTDIKSFLFRNIIKKESKLNYNCNKENEDINTEIKRNIKREISPKESSTSSSMKSKLFTEIDNKNIIKIIEQNENENCNGNENNNFTNKKKKKIPLISSKLANYTPSVRNKFESKFINKIPKGKANISKINKIDMLKDKNENENIEVKNLDNLFRDLEQNESKVSPPKKNRNRNISDLAITRNITKIHKAISSGNVRNKNASNVLFTDFHVEKLENNLIQIKNNLSRQNGEKASNSPPASSRETKCNSKNDNENSISKCNEGPIRRLFAKIKYNSAVSRECGESELIRIIRNIKQHQDIHKSRKKSANNSGLASIENEHSQIKKQLGKFYKKREINRNYLEKEKSKEKEKEKEKEKLEM